MNPPAVIADVDPELASAWPDELSLAEVEPLVTRSIWAGRLGDVARALLEIDPDRVDAEARALAAQAASCCATIAAGNRAELERMVGLLGRAGIAGASQSGPVPQQVPAVQLRIEPAAVATAIAVAAEHGYSGPDVDPDAQTHASLVKADDFATRLTLRWRDDPAWRRLARRLAGRRRPSSGAYLATPPELTDSLLDLAGVGPDDVVVDVGCGDGRVVAAAARRGCPSRGVELDGALVKMARAGLEAAGLADRAAVDQGDMADANLAGATVIFAFLPAHLLAAVLPRLVASGARVVAHEQSPLPEGLLPDRSLPLLGRASLTVAHLWGTE